MALIFQGNHHPNLGIVLAFYQWEPDELLTIPWPLQYFEQPEIVFICVSCSLFPNRAPSTIFSLCAINRDITLFLSNSGYIWIEPPLSSHQIKVSIVMGILLIQVPPHKTLVEFWLCILLMFACVFQIKILTSCLLHGIRNSIHCTSGTFLPPFWYWSQTVKIIFIFSFHDICINHLMSFQSILPLNVIVLEDTLLTSELSVLPLFHRSIIK